MYSLLIVCIFTSDLWKSDLNSARLEIFSSFSGYLLFGKIHIYHLFSGLMLFLYFYMKSIHPRENNAQSDKNFLKTIFWLYFIPVNILQYVSGYINNITIRNYGIYSIGYFLIYLVVVYYVQDIFFKDEHAKILNTSITSLEFIILLRAFYSIIKYALGIGPINPIIGGIRLGKENDFADFFCLLFIIAFTRLLFRTDKNISLKILHIAGIITALFIAIFSYRRYFIIEILIASIIIIYLYYHKNKNNISIIFISGTFLIISFVLSLILFIGSDRFFNNFYIGRLISGLSLISDSFESNYGDETGHRAEIEDGWNNVKKNWILGITSFGNDKVVRIKTIAWQKGSFVHNGYLQIWLIYGFLGFILFIYLYLKSLVLGYSIFFKLKNETGLILIAFITCQLFKNIVWPTAIYSINVTIVYIFLISILIKMKKIETIKQQRASVCVI